MPRTEEFQLKIKEPYSLKLTALSHGWVNLLPFEWDEKNGRLFRTEKLSNWKYPVFFEITKKYHGNLCVKLNFDGPSLSGKVLEELIKRLNRTLCVNWDTKPLMKLADKIDWRVAKLIREGGGRLLRGTTYFEDVVKTLFTTNASWPSTRKMVKNLISAYGIQNSFPSPIELRHVSENNFREKARVGYRAKYLVNIVKLFNDLDENTIANKKMPGLASYGMSHLNVLNGDFSAIPIDSEVKAFCRKEFGVDQEDAIQKLFKNWGIYAFLGYKLLRQAKKINWIG
jgi:N-glycosylase/DNA lyase